MTIDSIEISFCSSGGHLQIRCAAGGKPMRIERSLGDLQLDPVDLEDAIVRRIVSYVKENNLLAGTRAALRTSLEAQTFKI